MTVGFVMLVHEALDRAAQVARHWAASGAPVVIHVDARVPDAAHAAFVRLVEGAGRVRFVRRRPCEWGTWSLVQASLDGIEEMLDRFGDVTHVYLASGACLPLRPHSDLSAFLAARPGTDFIESVTIEDVPWAKGGLDDERFTLTFPFAWKRQRRLFDLWTGAQRMVGRTRSMPHGIQPHLGSQWWCLTRATLERLVGDERRDLLTRYFRKVWIPDESYFQTLVRLYSSRIESRSLTLSEFDFQGKPHVFYDDHLPLLRDSRAFVARKIWPRAGKLYAAFPERAPTLGAAEPDATRVHRHFRRALVRRTEGRPGLCHAGRHPNPGWGAVTAGRYAVLQGFAPLIRDFPAWMASTTGARCHGRLFAPGEVHFAGGEDVVAGAIPASAPTRDADPEAFLRNLLWASRGETQAFLLDPADRQEVLQAIHRDPNAHVYVIAGAWALSLWLQGLSANEARSEAARLQRVEAEAIRLLRGAEARARVRLWSLAEAIEAPMEPLQVIAADLAPREMTRLVAAPTFVPLDGFGVFLQQLRNLGMNLYAAGGIEPFATDVPQERMAR